MKARTSSPIHRTREVPAKMMPQSVQDVYKRQGQFLLLIAWSGLVVYEYGSEGAERSGLFHGPVFRPGEGKGAVSYTHLDVYKRQVSGSSFTMPLPSWGMSSVFRKVISMS